MADQPDEQVVQQTINRTKPGKDDHDQRKRVYDRAYEVYRPSSLAKRPTAVAGMSRLKIPYAQAQIDTALVNIAQGQPSCKVLPRLPMYRDSAPRFQLLMDYYADKDRLSEKDALIVQQALIFGVTIGKNHWLYKEGTKTEKLYTPQPDGTSAMTVDQPAIVLYDGPSFEPWDVYSAWWDPNGRDVDTCDYFVLESWITKDTLKKNACTVEGDHGPYECNGIYHDSEKLIQSGARTQPMSSAQQRFLNENENAKKGLYQVWEVWRDDRCTMIGNQQVLLRDNPNPHWHGKKPIVAASMRPDLFKIMGVPETELIDQIQQAVWTSLNLMYDNHLLTVQRGFTYREGSVIDPDKFELKPRMLVPVTDHDDLQPIEVQPLPPEAYRVREILLGDMQQVTGISPYVSGADSAGVDQNTATGVSVLNSAASRLLQFKAVQVRLKIWERSFQQWGDMIQQYMDTPQAIRIEGPDGELDFQEVNPQEVVGDYDFKLVGTEDAISKSQDRNEIMGLLNALAPFVQGGLINPKPLIEHIARVFNYDNPSELFVQPPPPQPAAPAAPPGGAPPNGMQPANGPPGAQQQAGLNPAIQQLLYPRQG